MPSHAHLGWAKGRWVCKNGLKRLQDPESEKKVAKEIWTNSLPDEWENLIDGESNPTKIHAFNRL